MTTSPETEGADGADSDSEKSTLLSSFDTPSTSRFAHGRHDASEPADWHGQQRSFAKSASATAPQTALVVSDSCVAAAKAVSWRDLPRKDQLIVITLIRLSEPLVQTSLQVLC